MNKFEEYFDKIDQFTNGNKFNGTIITSVGCMKPRMCSIAVLRHPEIERTFFGVRLLDGDARIDIDFRDAVCKLSEIDDFCIYYKYPDSPMEFSICAMP